MKIWLRIIFLVILFIFAGEQLFLAKLWATGCKNLEIELAVTRVALAKRVGAEAPSVNLSFVLEQKTVSGEVIDYRVVGNKKIAKIRDNEENIIEVDLSRVDRLKQISAKDVTSSTALSKIDSNLIVKQYKIDLGDPVDQTDLEQMMKLEEFITEKCRSKDPTCIQNYRSEFKSNYDLCYKSDEIIDRKSIQYCVSLSALKTKLAKKHDSGVIPTSITDSTTEGIILEADILSQEEAELIFEYYRDRPDIAHYCYEDQCYARAHELAKTMEGELGIKGFKTFTGDPSSLKPSIRHASSGEEIVWSYHIATSVLVKARDGTLQKMVIDPSLFEGPVTMETWLDAQYRASQVTPAGHVGPVAVYDGNDVIKHRDNPSSEIERPNVSAKHSDVPARKGRKKQDELIKRLRSRISSWGVPESKADRYLSYLTFNSGLSQKSIDKLIDSGIDAEEFRKYARLFFIRNSDAVSEGVRKTFEFMGMLEKDKLLAGVNDIIKWKTQGVSPEYLSNYMYMGIGASVDNLKNPVKREIFIQHVLNKKITKKTEKYLRKLIEEPYLISPPYLSLKMREQISQKLEASSKSDDFK